MVEENKFDEIEFLIGELNECIEWLKKLNIKQPEGSRLLGIVKYLELILKSRKENDARVLDKYDSYELYYAYYEAISFMKIKRAFYNFKSDQLRRHDLKEILRGPFKPIDEESGSGNVNTRNKLFELELAAIIQNGKSKLVKVAGFDDIRLKVNSKIVFIECKRLVSLRKEQVIQNIIRAAKQLGEKIIDKKSAGIIGLAIEKILSLDQIFEFSNQDEAFQFLNTKVSEWISESGKEIWRVINDRRIIGVIVCCKLFFKDHKGNISHFQMLAFLHREQSARLSERRVIRNLKEFFDRDVDVLSGFNKTAN